MAIPSKQVGQSAEANLLWQIARQLQQLTQVTYTSAGGSQNLQQVTDLGATTTNTITAQKLIKQGGTSNQFLKANGDVDSSVYQTASQVQTIADGKVSQNITDGVTTTAPSENAVFDALALKANLASPTFTGTVTLPKTTTINTYSPIVNIVKDAVPTTPITGTLTETIFNSYLIPANTFSANDMMKIPYFEVSKVGNTTGANVKIYINTSNTLTGAVQIIRYNLTTFIWVKLNKQFNINAGVLTGYLFGATTALTDILQSSGVFNSTSFNPAIDNYIITTGQLSLATESIQQRGFNVTN